MHFLGSTLLDSRLALAIREYDPKAIAPNVKKMKKPEILARRTESLHLDMLPEEGCGMPSQRLSRASVHVDIRVTSSTEARVALLRQQWSKPDSGSHASFIEFRVKKD